MEEDQQSGGSVVVKGRATIDTRPPFRSVKEAVALFGERVLVGEIYAKQLKEMQITKAASEKDDVTSKLGAVSTELEETKQKLQKAREEGSYMANCIKSLRQELAETKRELRHLKATKDVVKEQPKLGINPEIEELKFVEINHNLDTNHRIKENDYHQRAFQKKKAVTFASPPSLTREIKESPSSMDSERGSSKLGRTPSFRNEGNKKPAVAIMGWLLPKKNRGYQGDHIHMGSPQN